MKFWALILLLSVQWGVNRKNREGAELYEEGKLEEALRAFTEAQIESPDAPEIHYNIGNVHYRKQDLEKALEEYRAALGGEAEVRRRDFFNIGNVFFKGERFDGAAAAYKEALKIDPEDLEARQNLELALRREEEQQQQQQQQEGGNDQEENKEEQQEQSQQEDTPQGGSEQEEQTNEQQSSQAQPRDGEQEERTMTPQEADRILAALEEMEKEEQRRQHDKKIREPDKPGKVW